MRITNSLQSTETIHAYQVWRFLFDCRLIICLFLGFAWTPFNDQLSSRTFYKCCLAVHVIRVVREVIDVDLVGAKTVSALLRLQLIHIRVDIETVGGHSGTSLQRHDFRICRHTGQYIYIVQYVCHNLELAYALLEDEMSTVPFWLHVNAATVVWLQADNFSGAFNFSDLTMSPFLVPSFNP